MENQQPHLGVNRTGLATSPSDSAKLIAGLEELQQRGPDDVIAFEDFRSEYIREADDLGSVPIPTTVSGVLKTGVKMIKGDSPQLLMDKLAERLAFERGGTRLYDALITKFSASPEVPEGVTLEDIAEIRADEARHFQMLSEAITSLGGDPTAMTPSADVVGVETSGLMQVLNDPRTTFMESLHAIHIAELADVDGWTLLIDLAEAVGEEEMAERFRAALLEENHHLQKVRGWHRSLVLAS